MRDGITNNGGTLSNASSYAGTQSLAGSATYGALAGTLSVVSGGAATLGGAVTGTVSLAAGGSARLLLEDHWRSRASPITARSP